MLGRVLLAAGLLAYARACALGIWHLALQDRQRHLFPDRVLQKPSDNFEDRLPSWLLEPDGSYSRADIASAAAGAVGFRLGLGATRLQAGDAFYSRKDMCVVSLAVPKGRGMSQQTLAWPRG